MSAKKINLFWWSEPRLMGKQKENYGDLISKYIVEKFSGKSVIWIQPRKVPWYKFPKTNYLAAGSIIHHSSTKSIVWGSGIIDHKQKVVKADFRAVRGPRTRDYLLKSGYDCPEIYGDPAILLPKLFNPIVSKRYKYGIVPHYHDFQDVKDQYNNRDEVNVIDIMTLDIEEVTKNIIQCEKIISSSLHGLIVAHAYGIPAIWIKFSDKLFGDGVKFQDYFESVNLNYSEATFWNQTQTLEKFEEEFKFKPALPNKRVIEGIQRDLLKSCPFRRTIK